MIPVIALRHRKGYCPRSGIGHRPCRRTAAERIIRDAGAVLLADADDLIADRQRKRLGHTVAVRGKEEAVSAVRLKSEQIGIEYPSLVGQIVGNTENDRRTAVRMRTGAGTAASAGLTATASAGAASRACIEAPVAD